LSKLVAEKLCDALAHKTGAQIASLRFAAIYTEAHRPMLLEGKKNPIVRGTGALWSYIEAGDAAPACRLALEADFSGHQASISARASRSWTRRRASWLHAICLRLKISAIA
jgi:nucleoside-diphosphate-sugar epimerase